MAADTWAMSERSGRAMAVRAEADDARLTALEPVGTTKASTGTLFCKSMVSL